MNYLEEFDAFFIVCILILIGLIFTLIKIKKIESRLKLKPSKKVFVWNIFLTASLFFFVFMIGESYYRFYVDETDSYGISKVSKRWKARYSRLNNMDIRDDVIYYNKIQQGKRRLTIIGDSFSNGYGIKDVNKRYGNILRDRYPNIEVHVIAVPGANSYAQLQNMKKLQSEGYEFDVILLAYCLNDIDYFTVGTNRIYKRIWSFSNKFGFLLKNSYFLNTLAFRYFALNDPDFMNYSDFVLRGYQEESWVHQKKVLQDIKRFSDEQQANLLVVTFPFLQQKFEEYSFKEIHLQLWDFWKSQNVNYIDLLNVYKPYLGKNLSVNKYDAHPNEFAHELVFYRIERFLQKKG